MITPHTHRADSASSHSRPPVTPITERARRYLSRMDPAISGSGGRRATFAAALALVKGFSLPEDEALALLSEWNTACSPPWTDRDLRMVLKDAAKSRKPDGYLLGDAPEKPPEDEAGQRRRKRQRWSMSRLRPADWPVVAGMRHVSEEAVALLYYHQFLWRGKWRGHDVFIIRNGPAGTFAQGRRLDGGEFDRDGKMVKALNLPGAEGQFLCPGGLGGDDVPVLLIEGAIGLLEAAEFTLRAGDLEGRLKSIALLAATSSSSRFTQSLLLKLRGRKILILADADGAGQNAAAIWSGQLTTAGCAVRVLLPPEGCRDFGDLLKTVPASDPVWSQITTFIPAN